MSRRRTFLTTVLAFVALGPLVGNTTWVVLLWISAAFGESSIRDLDTQITVWAIMISLLGAGIPFAYILGFFPALISGVVVAAGAISAPSLFANAAHWRAAAAAVVGAIVSGCSFALRHDPRSHEESFVAFVVAGGTAAFVVGYFWPSAKSLLSNKSTGAPCEDART